MDPRDVAGITRGVGPKALTLTVHTFPAKRGLWRRRRREGGKRVDREVSFETVVDLIAARDRLRGECFPANSMWLDPANDAAMRKIADAATALMNSTRMRYGPTADAFARYLAGRFSRRDGGGAPGPAASAAPEPPPGPLGLADRLEKLAALHERGVLTDAEFAKAKALQLGL